MIHYPLPVEASDEREAFELGRRLPESFAGADAGGVEVQVVEELERRLAESNAPELLGIAEVVEALGVSDRGVYEITELKDFPAPIVRLKAIRSGSARRWSTS